MLKKLIAILTLICMTVSLCACAKKAKDEKAVAPDYGEQAAVPTDDKNVSDDETAESTPSTDTVTDKPENESVTEPTLQPEGEAKGEGAGSYAEAESGNIIAAGDHSINADYVIQGSVTNDNGYFPSGNTDLQYGEVIENKFIKTAEESTSTFAADVDTASYATLRNFINGNMDVPESSVRVEEMINYFSYDYGTPKDGEPFAVSAEIVDSPWSKNKLLRIGLETQQPDYSKMPDSNLVFLIDVSGSMDTANKLPLVKQAFSMLTENMGKNDKISIVTYAASDKVVIEGYGADRSFEIQNAIENLSAGGSTYGSKGIITAYEIAEKYFIKGGNNRVILATDGDLNVGVTSTEELTELVKEKKESGIFLSVMGFGTYNLMDDKLESIADNGNGNYSYIDSATEARKVLVEEMGGTLFTVAKDVKLQIEFNKDAVSEYRLVGYENRVMANEDFEDDTKDGGEIGAGHRVTVLYEIKVSDKNAKKWCDLSIRHKKPDGDKSELNTYTMGKADYTKAPSEDTLFAVSVAQFGMLIRGSENVNGSYADIVSRIKDLECVKTDEYKKQFLGFVKKYAG